MALDITSAPSFPAKLAIKPPFNDWKAFKLSNEIFEVELIGSVYHIPSSKALAVAVLMGTIAFVSTGFLPSPFDKILILFQALAFALSSLALKRGGATLASLVNGVLLSILRTVFFPFSLLFSLTYGILIDSLFYAVKVAPRNSPIKTKSLVIALAIATGTTGVVSMYLTTLIGLIPMVPTLYLGVLVAGGN